MFYYQQLERFLVQQLSQRLQLSTVEKIFTKTIWRCWRMTKPDGNWGMIDIWKEGAALNEVPFHTALPLRTHPSHPSQPSGMAETQRICRVACRKTKQRTKFLRWPQQLDRKGKSEEKEKNREDKSHVLDINAAQISGLHTKLCMCAPVYEQLGQVKGAEQRFQRYPSKKGGLETVQPS